ncbi:hypothetical protein [Halalkalibacter okhensis]|uniref:hypothetical protein n=1 Tax=Halalkalibacter okhensis TaxID=333138 RepID=UPI000A97AE97|nr:hypothetical protein [Halalkalibacter okhensis]
MLHLCRKLATIHCEVDIQCTLEESFFAINEEKMVKKFAELELKNLDNILL